MIDLAGSYCGAAPTPVELAARWNGDPLLALVLLAGGAALFMQTRRRMLAAGAMAALVLAFLSPLCAASVALFSARSVHHLLLTGVAAPLLAAALPLRRSLSPGLALAIATLAFWGWHVPAFYDAALAEKPLYWAMQASLLGTAWAFWSAVHAAALPSALVAVTGGAAQMGLLGALLTFAPRPLYTSHLATTVPFGIGPLADQQLAGLLMWTAGMIPYATIAAHRMRGDWQRMAGAPA